MFSRLSIVLAVALAAPAARAAVIHVPGDQPTIQAGIDAASPGDEVVVAPGTYNVQFIQIDIPITLRSSGGADVTTIAGDGLFPVMSVSDDPVIQGFTIRDGVNDSVGISPAAGIAICSGDPTILDCIFIDNHADNNFAAGAIGGCVNGTSCTVSGCIFINNQTSQSGGAIYMLSATISNCTFQDNNAEDPGGAIWIAEGTVENCTFDNNSGGNGGAIWCGANVSGAGPSITGCTFVANTASGGGGGVYVEEFNGKAGSVTDCAFDSNVASDAGGGAWIEAPGVVTGCDFLGNSAFNGAGLAMVGGDVTDCSFDGNTAASNGGGLHVTGSAPAISQCTIGGNSALGAGGGMYTGGGVTATLTDTTFCQNVPDDLDANGVLSASNVVIAIDGADCDGAVATLGACCLPDGGCITTTESSCLAAAGVYQGDGAACAEAACPEPCPGDVNNDGVVSVEDFLLLLSGWGPCL